MKNQQLLNQLQSLYYQVRLTQRCNYQQYKSSHRSEKQERLKFETTKINLAGVKNLIAKQGCAPSVQIPSTPADNILYCGFTTNSHLVRVSNETDKIAPTQEGDKKSVK